MQSSKNVAVCAVFVALSLVLSLVESMLPPIIAFFPYAKIGLANIAITILIIYYGFPIAFLTQCVRCFLMSIFSGNVSSLLYSLPSGIICVIVSYILLKKLNNSIIFTCSISALIHNMIQLIVSILITKTVNVIAYAPHLILIGTLCGVVTGIIVYITIKKMPSKVTN